MLKLSRNYFYFFMMLLLSGSAAADGIATAPSLNIQLGPEWNVDKPAPVPGSNRVVAFYTKNSTTPQAEELNTAQITMTGSNNYNDVVSLLYTPGKSALQNQGCQLVDIGSVPSPVGAPLQKFGYYLQCAATKLSGFDMYMMGNANTLYFMAYRVHGFPSTIPQQQEMVTVLNAIQVCVNPASCFSAASN